MGIWTFELLNAFKFKVQLNNESNSFIEALPESNRACV